MHLENTSTKVNTRNNKLQKRNKLKKIMRSYRMVKQQAQKQNRHIAQEHDDNYKWNNQEHLYLKASDATLS